MQARLGRLALTAGVLWFSIPALAHHSAAVAYDITKTVTIEGVIAQSSGASRARCQTCSSAAASRRPY